MTRRGRWQLAIIMLTATPRLVATALSAPIIAPDSERYRNEAMPLEPFAVWDGHGPGVLTQTVHLLPLSTAVLVQTALVIVLWGAAAMYAASVATDRLSWPTFLAIHAWSLSPWFFLWDSWVLTESLTLAGCALASVGIGAVRSNKAGGPWVAVIGLAAAVTARPFVGAALLPLVALALFWPLSAARLRAMTAPFLAGTLLALFASWQVLAFTTAASSPFSYLPEPESLTQVQATDRYAGRGHLPGYLDLARDADMPPCPEAEALALGPLSEFEKISRLRTIADCPEFDQWLAAGGLPWTREFTDNTSATIRELIRPSYWLDGAFASYIAANDRIRHLREVSRRSYDAAVFAVNAVMLAATAAASLAVVLRGRGQRAFVVTSLAVVTLVSLYAWGTDGIEYWRHILPAFAILLPLAVTLLGCSRSARASPMVVADAIPAPSPAGGTR